jgi:hypothetical protein
MHLIVQCLALAMPCSCHVLLLPHLALDQSPFHFDISVQVTTSQKCRMFHFGVCRLLKIYSLKWIQKYCRYIFGVLAGEFWGAILVLKLCV